MEHTWSARSTRPIMAVYVAAIFVGFMALAYFVLHSAEAVKALAMAGVGGVAALFPGILNKWEYRLTDAGLARRPLSAQKPRDFKDLFSWDDLSHLVPTRTGFKYYKKLDEPRPLARALKVHVLGDYSGEFHVERPDREEVRALVEGYGVAVLGPSRSEGDAGRPQGDG